MYGTTTTKGREPQTGPLAFPFPSLSFPEYGLVGVCVWVRIKNWNKTSLTAHILSINFPPVCALLVMGRGMDFLERYVLDVFWGVVVVAEMRHLYVYMHTGNHSSIYLSFQLATFM